MIPLRERLTAIRDLLDTNTKELAIDSIVAHGKDLSAMIGLSAECKSEARRNLENARMIAIKMHMDKKITPSILSKLIDGACADEIAQFEYADRLNAGIVHQLDFVRSVLSLHKQELQTSNFNH